MAAARIRIDLASKRAVEATFAAGSGPLTVLVVDHDLKGRSLLQSKLEAEGYVVTFAASASEAMKLLSPGRPLPSIIVAEAELPGDDGFELCARVRSDGRTAVLPVVLLSRTVDAERKSRAGAVGADDFVARPVYANDVVALVRLLAGGQLLNAEVVIDTDELSVHRVVRALLSGVRSGKLSTEDGQLLFRDGRIVDAKFRGTVGSAAVTRLLLLTDGEYSITFGPALGRADFVIGLEEFCRKFDAVVARFTEVSSRALPIDAVLGVDFQKLAANLSALPDEVNTLVRLFDGRRRVRDVILEASFSETVTLEAATRLYTLGVLAPTTHNDVTSTKVAPRFMEPQSQATVVMKELFGASEPPVPELQPLPEPDWILDRMSPALQAQLDAFGTRLVAEPAPALPAMHVSQMDAFAAGVDTYDRSLEEAINASLVGLDDEAPIELRVKKSAPEVDVELELELELDIDVTEPEVSVEDAFFGAEAEVQPSALRRPMLGALAVTLGVAGIAFGLAFVVAGNTPSSQVIAAAPVVVEAPKPAPVVAAVEPVVAAEVPTLEQGIAFYEAGLTDDAVAWLEQVVLHHDDPAAWSMLGLARFDSGDAKGAEVAAKKAIELDAKNGRARMLLASIYISWREHDLADAQLQKYLEVEPKGEFAREAQELMGRKRLPKKLETDLKY